MFNDQSCWEWIFWLNVPVGLVAAALAARIVPESGGASGAGRFDATGAAMLTVALLTLSFTLGEAARVGWGASRTLGGLTAAAVLLGAFVAIEARASAPIVPLRAFRMSSLRTANLAAVLVFGTFAAVFFFASLFMQQGYGYSPLKAGVAYLPLAVCVAVGAGFASALMAKASSRGVLLGGLGLAIIGLLLLHRAPVGGRYVVDLLPAFVVFGLGCGACYVSLQVAAFAGVSDDEAGLGAGLINTSQEAGGALGLAFVATVAYSGIADALQRAAAKPHAIQTVEAAAGHRAFLTAAALASGALAIAATLMPRPRAATALRPAANAADA